MPILSFDERHKQDLAFLSQVPPQVIFEFGKIAIEFLKKGANKKVYASAAQKLNIDVLTVASSVEGLSQLFAECSKYLMNETDFLESIAPLSFPPELNQELKNSYLANRAEIRSILTDRGFSMPQYHSLEWRLDIQLGSRSVRNQTEPLFLLKLNTTNTTEDSNTPTSTRYLQTDFVNLKNLTTELESALQEIKSGHCRRLMRNIK